MHSRPKLAEKARYNSLLKKSKQQQQQSHAMGIVLLEVSSNRLCISVLDEGEEEKGNGY